MSIVVGVAQRPCDGETACGDGYFADRGGAYVSVVDGLGHGPHAEEAAVAFADAARPDDSFTLVQIMERAGRSLARTRGAAAALMRIDENARRLEFIGVGNIHMHAIAPVRMHPVCAPGVVGHRVRKLLPFEFELPETALIALCSDGISSRPDLGDFEHLHPQEIADAVLERHGKSYDDATCLVLRYSSDG